MMYKITRAKYNNSEYKFKRNILPFHEHRVFLRWGSLSYVHYGKIALVTQ